MSTEQFYEHKLNELTEELKEIRRLLEARSPATYLTTREAAAYLRISVSTLQKRTAENAIPFIKQNGKNNLYLVKDLDTYLLQHRIATTEELNTSLLSFKNVKR
jgi:excisionase family DNA binding protein